MTLIPEPPPDQRGYYRQFAIGSWAGWIHSDYWHAEAESELAQPRNLLTDERVQTWLKQGRNRLAIVSWPLADGSRPGSMVIKSYEPGSSFNRLRLMKGAPRALRHWNACWLLRNRGINTPLPVMVALDDSSGNDQGILGVETVHDSITIRGILRSISEGARVVDTGAVTMPTHEFAATCGRYVREIHDRNVVHRDFSGANILIPRDWSPADRPLSEQFIMIDINRIREVGQGEMSINLRIQDLERLGIPEFMLESYYSAYAGEDKYLAAEWPRFLKYRKGYRRIRETKNPLARGLLKTFTYWPRTG